MRLYHLSRYDLGEEALLTPRIPCGMDGEDMETPRVCFSPTIKGCIKAIGRTGTYYVYVPVERPQFVVLPSVNELKNEGYPAGAHFGRVPDADETKEVWVTEQVWVRRVRTVTWTTKLAEPLPEAKMKPRWPTWVKPFTPDLFPEVRDRLQDKNRRLAAPVHKVQMTMKKAVGCADLKINPDSLKPNVESTTPSEFEVSYWTNYI